MPTEQGELPTEQGELPTEQGELPTGQFIDAPELPLEKFLEKFSKTLSAAEHPSTRHNKTMARQPLSKLPDALACTLTVFVRWDGHVPPLYDGPYAILCRSLHHFTLRTGDKEDKVYTLRLKPCTDPTVPPAQPRARGRPPTAVCCWDFPPLNTMAARRVHFAPPHVRELCQEPFSPDQPPEPVFLNVYGAQESIPRNEFRQPM